jgi:murein L,D-transpeptidase YcbB/YkuD
MGALRSNSHAIAAVLAALLFLCASNATAQSAPAAKPKSPAARAAASPAAVELRPIVASGKLDDLRWPDFSDYRLNVENFYKPTNYSLAWLRDSKPTPQAQVFFDIFAKADTEGLNPDDYDSPRWPERIARLAADHTAADEARFDAALTVCAMRYISDMRIGKVNPAHFKFDLSVGPKKLDLPKYLRGLLAPNTDIAAELAKIEPQFPAYKRTREALLQYEELARKGDGEPVPVAERSIAPGSPYDGLPQLAKRLELLGDMPADTQLPDTQYYGNPWAAAVTHFQERHGLSPTGFLNPETFEALNTPLSDRVAQLRRTLERWRWLPTSFDEPPVIVNIPEFRLRVGDGRGGVALDMKVNIGEAYETQTPVLRSNMAYLVFRPYWDVPAGIQRNELAPAIAEDRDWVRNNNFEVISASSQVITSGRISDDVLQKLRNGSARLRQKPGPDNSMGLVKFIFPNAHSVYLHDTAAGLDLFSDIRRDLSHGCIHVERPAELATLLLAKAPGWDADKVDAAMHTGRDNFRVNLPKPVPVLLLYRTAVVEPNGEVRFFRDIYGYDKQLEEVLAKGYPYPG